MARTLVTRTLMTRSLMARPAWSDAGTRRRVAWGLLWVLLAFLVVAAATYDRTGELLPGESTVLMQTDSLRTEGDLRFERTDFDRLLLAVAEPPDLELASGSHGRDVTFDRPFPYALWLLPFAAWKAETGFALANALLLALAALLAALALERRIGVLGPLWIAALVFVTPIFLSVFRADGDAWVVAVVFLASALALGLRPDEDEAAGGSERGETLRWLGVGICVALAGAWQPMWLVLLPAMLLVPRRGDARILVLFGFLGATMLQVIVQWWVGGGLHFFGTVRFRFTPATGFPTVDFPTVEWEKTIQRLAALHFDGAPRLAWGFDPRLWLWNVAYLLFGRHGGLVPYAAPVLVAALAGGATRRGRRAWWLTVAVSAVAVLVLHPFDLFGGVAAVGPGRLLPWLALAPVVYAGARRSPPRRDLLVLGVGVLVSAFFLLPAWSGPRTPPVADDGTRAFVGTMAQRLLPYETSQQPLPGGPWEDIAGLRIRFLEERGWGESRRDRLVLDQDVAAATPARMLVVSSVPVERLLLDFGPEASSKLIVGGGSRGELMLRPSGGVGFEVEPVTLRSHPMWWSPTRRWLYELTLHFDEPLARPLPFRLGVLVAADSAADATSEAVEER